MSELKILYVDDEPDLREVAVMSLEIDPGLSVRAAASGKEALEVLEGGYQPDVMLFDVMMPHMDGPALLAEVRTRPETADTPVIFITARAQSRELESFLALGACGVIVKPFDPMTLALELRAILSRAAR
jgi:CheY-like chemotaxis protein